MVSLASLIYLEFIDDLLIFKIREKRNLSKKMKDKSFTYYIDLKLMLLMQMKKILQIMF